MYLTFLEIIELNFCDLNKNTMKNIANRAINDIYEEDSRDTYLDTYYDEDDKSNSNISGKDYQIDEENNSVMLPPYQSFAAGNVSGIKADLGLIIYKKFLVYKSCPER